MDRHFKFVLKTSKTTRGIQKAGRLGQKKINKYASYVNRIDRQYTNKNGKIELRVYTSIIAYGSIVLGPSITSYLMIRYTCDRTCIMIQLSTIKYTNIYTYNCQKWGCLPP